MFNKLYEKFKKIIKDSYKEIIVFICLLVFITYPLPYYIYIGGGIIDLSDRIDLESNETGSYNLAYVSQLKATIPTYLLSYLIDSWKLEKVSNSTYDSSEDQSDVDKREKLYLEEANSNAIINAYKLAGADINIISSDYKVIYVSSLSDTNIKIGDTLVSVNGISISNNTEYKNYLNTLDVEDELKVIVKRDDKEIECYAKLKEIDNEKVIGLYLVNIYEYELNPNLELKFKWNESGPSGGFMLSLAIYDRLIDEDLTKGRKIVGTGTIDALGNVGEIGGVSYKLMGAVKANADIFFVPYENYDEAMETKNKYGYSIEIVKVKTLSDAITYLES